MPRANDLNSCKRNKQIAKVLLKTDLESWGVWSKESRKSLTNTNAFILWSFSISHNCSWRCQKFPTLSHQSYLTQKNNNFNNCPLAWLAWEWINPIYHYTSWLTCMFGFKYVYKALEHSHQLFHKKCHFNTLKTYFIILTHHFIRYYLSDILYFNSIH